MNSFNFGKNIKIWILLSLSKDFNINYSSINVLFFLSKINNGQPNKRGNSYSIDDFYDKRLKLDLPTLRQKQKTHTFIVVVLWLKIK